MNEFAWWMAQNAAVTALLVPVVWVVCRVRRSRPAEQHLLWLLLLVKLVTPPVVQWPWSAGELAECGAPASDVTDGASTSVADVAPRPLPMADSVEEVWLPLSTEPILMPEATVFEPAVAIEALPLAGDPPAESTSLVPIDKTNLRAPLIRVALTVWLVGAVFIALRIASHVRRQRSILRSSQEAPPALRLLVGEVSAVLGLRPVAVRVSSRTDSPFVSCLGRPVLVWPESLAAEDAVTNVCGVVAHELAHVRRRDHWVARLEALAAPLWWWNPVFWYVRRRLDETRELACDAVALESAPADRRALAELLLAFSASGRSALPFAPLRTGLAPRHSLRKRLAMLFDESVSGRVSSAGLVLAGLLALAVLPGWASGQEEPPATPSAEAPAVVPTAPAAEVPTSPSAEPPSAVPATPSADNVPGTLTANDYAFPVSSEQPVGATAPRPPSAEPPAAPQPEQPLQPDQPAAPPQPANPAAVPALPPSPEQQVEAPGEVIPSHARQVYFGEGKVVMIAPWNDGKGVILRLVENGKLGPAIYLEGVTVQPTEFLFFTADWAGPSRQMQPVFEKLRSEGIPIQIVNVDGQPEVARQYRIENIPALVAVRDGHAVERIVGWQSESALRDFIKHWAEPIREVLNPPAATPAEETQPAAASGPQAMATARAAEGISDGRTASPPAKAANSSAARVKFAETALELAELEVEESQVLLEQGREDAARQQQLFEKGYSAERPRDLRLLEIELKKAQLRVRQAAIELEAARSPSPGL